MCHTAQFNILWKNRVREYLYNNHPNYVPLLTSKLESLARVYMEGYEVCLRENAFPPNNERELIECVLDAGINFVLDRIRKDENKKKV